MLPAIFGLSGPTLTSDERAFFRDADPAGYILFGRNVADHAQLRALTDDLRSLHGRAQTFICIDQEGGRVVRMKPPLWGPWPAQGMFDRLYEIAPISAIEAARCNAEALGLELAEAGITVDCLPLLDVRQPGADDVIGDRALGAEPLRVAALGRAVLQGLARAGVTGVIKHIPGHGRAKADSHKALPTVTADAAALEIDLAPFRALSSGIGAGGKGADAKVAMTAHVRFTAWDDAAPATLSPHVIGDVIRGQIGFAGLLLTDDLDMAALTGTIPERAALAQAAGCDLALNCWANMDDMRGIAAALAPLGAQSAARLAHALDGTDVAPVDAAGRRAALVATRDALLALAQ
jgi:beta-N-acetylhexosaminidase